MNNVSLAEYSLVEFLQSAQQFINKGWVFDFVDNAHVPTSFGTFYTAVLIPAEEQVVEATEEDKAETVTSQIDEPVEEQPKKRGRKTKEVKED